MIEINLLPENERKGRKKRSAGALLSAPVGGEKYAVIGAGVLVALIVVVLGFGSVSKVATAKSNFDRLQAEKKGLDKEVSELSGKAQEIREMREVLNNQWEILQSLDPVDRILWCEKIEMLANLMPPDVFLTEINVDETVKEIELESSIAAREKWEKDGRQGPKPQVVKKPIITYSLLLKGLTTGSSNVEQFDNVIKFHDALINHEVKHASGKNRRFMDNFDPNIEFETVRATLYEDVPVNEFIFKLRTLPSTPAANPETLNTAAGKPSKKPSA